MAGGGIEIERKYLLARAPTPEELARLGARSLAIEQVYLRSRGDAPVRRVRRTDSGRGVVYHYTEKREAEGIAREERESAIDETTFRGLLAEADRRRQPVRKVRHVFEHQGLTFELDVFERPAGLAILEVELDRTDQPVSLPPSLEVVREVTDDPRYLNVNLALR